MAKDKLNGSAERFAAALRDMVREAATEAVKPVRDDLAKLRSDMESGFAELRPPKWGRNSDGEAPRRREAAPCL